MKNLYIIDGNAYMYRAFYAIPHLNNSKGIPTNAVLGFLKTLIKILQNNIMADDGICVCFDVARQTFRTEIYPQYKAHRDKMPDDLVKQVPLIKESLMILGIKTFEMPGFEADDLIATIAQHAKVKKVKIISTDKDILQMINEKIAVMPIPKEYIIDETYFRQKFSFAPINMLDYLSIMGDSSDNIPGVRGIGKKGAKDLIIEYHSVENILIHLEKLKPSFRSKIKDDLKNLKLSKELITLKTNLPINFKEDDCIFRGIDGNNDFKNFLEDLELVGIAKSLYHKVELKSDLKDIKFIEKNIFNELLSEGLFNVTLIFSEDLATVYIKKKKEDILYKIAQSDFYFYKTELNDLFQHIKHIRTDNAKNLYAFFVKNNIEYSHLEIFDLLLAAYIADTAVQTLDLLIQKYQPAYFNKKDIFYKLHFLENIVIPDINENYFTIDLPFCEVLASMEKNGIKLDLRQLEILNREILSLINTTVRAIYDDVGEGFNINSPKQLGYILFEKLKFPVIKKTKTGFSTSEEVLKELSKTSDFPKKILKYRGLVKLNSTYIEPLMTFLDDNSRIHTTYNFTKTTTGRLSSVNPNLQNIPIRKEIASGLRKAFIADDGYLLVSADYSQIDLAVLAHLSRDKHISEAFINGEDIHTWTASLIFKKDIMQVTQKERGMAKQINFGLVYGKGDFSLAGELSISMKEAKDFISLYFSTFPTLKTYFDSLIMEAKKTGYVTTIMGRRRFIPELGNRNIMIQKQGERLVKNTPIQGSSADILKKAMVDIYKEFGESNQIKMLLQIHDEILFEIKEDLEEVFVSRVKDIMENAIKLDVPLRVNISSGKDWAELK
ncbi:MAG: DNA polymerase I [bacterium]|nr:DNA polymerase I [bacterium]